MLLRIVLTVSSAAWGRLGVAARKRAIAARKLTMRVVFCRVGLFVYVAFRKISPRIPPPPAG